MIIDNNNNITLVTQEKASIVELVKKLQIIYQRYKNDNIIVNLTSLKTLSTSDVIEFLEISNQHRKSKHSFVIVTDQIEEDKIPDELIIVPTLQEAYDIIEMEEIERDLGF
ncbi:ribonuclease Z [Yeosuana sp. MJ-SS3]|uniref:Ribonuclease Z n=1 Tax=Gilvirhabdus luticola TaxID=3079858 RepID=A0ABU3UA90_9FLAO|nr:ribonuclease Z [Yeosuana sp. MJ-SS3]MDU8887249.1 ribonuclease Z [Yeosuana sp. MJ-SS3]